LILISNQVLYRNEPAGINIFKEMALISVRFTHPFEMGVLSINKINTPSFNLVMIYAQKIGNKFFFIKPFAGNFCGDNIFIKRQCITRYLEASAHIIAPCKTFEFFLCKIKAAWGICPLAVSDGNTGCRNHSPEITAGSILLFYCLCTTFCRNKMQAKHRYVICCFIGSVLKEPGVKSLSLLSRNELQSSNSSLQIIFLSVP
jgi:hypothetical protein